MPPAKQSSHSEGLGAPRGRCGKVGRTTASTRIEADFVSIEGFIDCFNKTMARPFKWT
jgi:hypothetical protein